MNSRQKGRVALQRLPYYASSAGVLLTHLNGASLLRIPWLFFSRDSTMVLPKQQLRFRLRSLLDLLVLKEVVIDDGYEKYAVGVQVERGTIVDIGAGYGDFSIKYAKRYPDANVWSFEPDKVYYQFLQENMDLNAVTTITPVKKAVHTLKDIFALTGQGEIEFLKIDCEGGEFELFHQAQRADLRRIKKYAIEYHEFTGKKVGVIEKKLKASGFAVHTYPEKTVGDIGMIYALRH